MTKTKITSPGQLDKVAKVKYSNIPLESEWMVEAEITIDNCEFDEHSSSRWILALPHQLYVRDKKKQGLFLEKTKWSIVLKGCEFQINFSIQINCYHNFEFIYCKFLKIFDVKDVDLAGKIKFRYCEFHQTDFYNTTFKDLADFYECDFLQKVIFFKTDFLKTTVFSGSIFHRNVLFTYSLIEKLIIFRGTIFRKGLDLSLSIGNGRINCFDIRVKDFYAPPIKNTKEYEKTYSDNVTKKGIIPLKNKRETFRILKHTLVTQNNISESIEFGVLEKKALKEELRHKVYTPDEPKSKKRGLKQLRWLKLQWLKFKRRKKGGSWEKFNWWLEDWRWLKAWGFHIKNDLERLNLWLNWVSNNYGSSYGRALIFILVVGFITFSFSAITIEKFVPCLCWNPDAIKSGFGYYIQSLLPTHSFDYMGKSEGVHYMFFFWDFIGRIFVGYGVYQFIVAFRKYR